MISALVIGLVGSLHCVGMCGPLMMTFMGTNQSPSKFAFYHIGRILSYVFIGFILGLIGASFQLLQIQKVVTIIIGAGLLIIYLLPKSRNYLERLYYQSAAYTKVKSVLAKNLSVKKRWFIGGLANGFLPCGLTYVAAAGALVSGNVWTGTAYMIFFGLGTLPALVLVTFGGSYLLGKFKKNIPAAVPIIAVISGGILLTRGLLMTFPDFNQLMTEKALGIVKVCGF